MVAVVNGSRWKALRSYKSSRDIDRTVETIKEENCCWYYRTIVLVNRTNLKKAYQPKLCHQDVYSLHYTWHCPAHHTAYYYATLCYRTMFHITNTANRLAYPAVHIRSEFKKVTLSPGTLFPQWFSVLWLSTDVSELLHASRVDRVKAYSAILYTPSRPENYICLQRC